jgi:hypothetical protein
LAFGEAGGFNLEEVAERKEETEENRTRGDDKTT